MIDSVYLEIVVALAVVFFLCGLAISGLNEAINWCTRVRAKFLWAYLYELFSDRSDRPNLPLPRGRLGIIQLWTGRNDKRPLAGGAPVVVGGDTVAAQDWLTRLAYTLDPVDAPELTGKVDQRHTTIKHVPPPSLAQALLEVFADVGRQEITSAVSVITNREKSDAAVEAAIETLTRRLQLPPNLDVRALVKEFRATLAPLDPGEQPEARQQAAKKISDALLGNGVVDSAVTESWRKVAAEWPAVNPTTVNEVVDAVANVYPEEFARLRIATALAKFDDKSPVAPTLRRMWEAALFELDKFRSGVEKYFDAEMNRLSGYYRRSIRVVMLSLAVLFTVVSGLDAIDVARDLWRNPDDRTSLVARADELADSNDGSTVPTTVSSDPTPTTQPGDTTETESDGDTATVGTLERIQRQCAEAHPTDEAEINSVDEAAAAYGKVRTCVNDAINELTGVGVIDHALWIDSGAWVDAWTESPLEHAIGTIAAALALMLGAPFWFDVIKRITGIRRGLVGDT